MSLYRPDDHHLIIIRPGLLKKLQSAKDGRKPMDEVSGGFSVPAGKGPEVPEMAKPINQTRNTNLRRTKNATDHQPRKF